MAEGVAYSVKIGMSFLLTMTLARYPLGITVKSNADARLWHIWRTPFTLPQSAEVFKSSQNMVGEEVKLFGVQSIFELFQIPIHHRLSNLPDLPFLHSSSFNFRR
jgi:hypothetical protein